MTWFDYVVIGVMLLSLLIGLWRGLIKEVMSLIGWPLALICSYFFAKDVAPGLPEITDPEVQLILAYTMVFLVVLILWALLVWLLARFVRMIGLAWLDRTLGAVFGIIRGGCVIVLAAWLAGLTQLPEQGFWRDAQLRDIVESSALQSSVWLPDNIAEKITFGS